MSTATSKLPGIYREADGSRVSQADALCAWAVVALDELISTARHDGAVVTYKELAILVQETSGIRTRMIVANWIGKLLEEVGELAEQKGEPPLASLCVRADGTIGVGYARGADAAEREALAAQHRLLCYQKFAVAPHGSSSPR